MNDEYGVWKKVETRQLGTALVTERNGKIRCLVGCGGCGAIGLSPSEARQVANALIAAAYLAEESASAD